MSVSDPQIHFINRCDLKGNSGPSSTWKLFFWNLKKNIFAVWLLFCMEPVWQTKLITKNKYSHPFVIPSNTPCWRYITWQVGSVGGWWCFLWVYLHVCMLVWQTWCVFGVSVWVGVWGYVWCVLWRRTMRTAWIRALLSILSPLCLHFSTYCSTCCTS